MATKLKEQYLKGFLSPEDFDAIAAQAVAAHQTLCKRTGRGNDFLGWLDLPAEYDRDEFCRIQMAAQKIRRDSDVLVVIGIGGSYLGARAVIELLGSPLYNSLAKDSPQIYFAGNNMSSSQLCQLLSLCEGKRVSVNVISKSGTTTEPAIAFRVFREYLEHRYGKQEAQKRIYCTTDRSRGTLHDLAVREGYERFVIPDDVGGRYSVLTPVGLLPIAVSGGDIQALMDGAATAREELSAPDFGGNSCIRYAAIRNLFYRKGRQAEMMVSYDPSFSMMAEWYKQLFGESEGKEHKGLLPTAATFSTDLHSLGQFIQEGSPILFETIVDLGEPAEEFILPKEEENFDGLNFLAGWKLSEVNRKAMEGTALAHRSGGVPSAVLELPQVNAFETGYFIYFMEMACAVSGYLLGINPFDQPGVEAYKKNMFALLGKPGYEELRQQLEAQL